MNLIKKFSIFFNQFKFQEIPHLNYVEEYNLIFIHIPKNAGTSISKTIGLPKSNHAKAWEIRKQLGNKLYKNCFSFAVCRNPYDRFISSYHYAKMKESYYHSAINPEKARYGKHMDYDKLKNASLNDCVKMLINQELKHDIKWNHWKPQHYWTMNKNKNKVLVDKVYKLEELKQLSQDLTKITGKKINFIKENKSNSKYDNTNIKDLISKENLILLNKYYDRDFELFNYQKL